MPVSISRQDQKVSTLIPCNIELTAGREPRCLNGEIVGGDFWVPGNKWSSDLGDEAE